MQKNTRIYIVGLVLFLSGLGYLLYAGLTAGSAYHIDVAQALAMPADELRNARVFGSVGPDNIVRARGNLGVTFTLCDINDPSRTLRIDYAGAVPEGFKAGAEVYVEGGMNGPALFKARSLTASCPSKYKKENRN